MPEHRVSGWNELNDLVHQAAWKEPIGRFRSDFAYRGMSDASVDLATTLVRLGGRVARKEKHLYRNFRKYAGGFGGAVKVDSVWEWLTLGQHHGLPTRLLDWTFSPLVAMHFMTAHLEHFDRDGVIWMLDFKRAHALLPGPLRALLDAEEADVLTTEMLAATAATTDELDQLSPDLFVLFFEPPSMSQRIVNQFAMLSLLSNPAATMHDWLPRHPDAWHKLIVPAPLKWEIRDKLDQANITERVLFPGLDGLSTWLKRYYSPRQPVETDPNQVLER